MLPNPDQLCLSLMRRRSTFHPRAPITLKTLFHCSCNRTLARGPLLLALLFSACAAPASDDHAYRTWEVYLGDNTSSQYSSLDQINTDNVGQLQVAWTYHTGDADPELPDARLI